MFIHGLDLTFAALREMLLRDAGQKGFVEHAAFYGCTFRDIPELERWIVKVPIGKTFFGKEEYRTLIAGVPVCRDYRFSNCVFVFQGKLQNIWDIPKDSNSTIMLIPNSDKAHCILV